MERWRLRYNNKGCPISRVVCEKWEFVKRAAKGSDERLVPLIAARMRSRSNCLSVRFQ